MELSVLLLNMAPEKIINLTGRTSLLELLKILRYAKLIISNDSGPVHIALALKTPTVCMLGGGHYERFLPYPSNIGNELMEIKYYMPCFGCNWTCVYRRNADTPAKCLSNISSETVMRSVKNFLSQNS